MQEFRRDETMSLNQSLVCSALTNCDDRTGRIDEGHTAWMLVATGFVLLCVHRARHGPG